MVAVGGGEGGSGRRSTLKVGGADLCTGVFKGFFF